MKLLVWSIALIHFVFCQITRLPQCNKYGATFKVSKHKLKDGINENSGRIDVIGKIKSKEICSSLCTENEDCKSVFYGSKKDECHLYNKKFELDELEESTLRYYLTTKESKDDGNVSIDRENTPMSHTRWEPSLLEKSAENLTR